MLDADQDEASGPLALLGAHPSLVYWRLEALRHSVVALEIQIQILEFQCPNKHDICSLFIFMLADLQPHFLR